MPSTAPTPVHHEINTGPTERDRSVRVRSIQVLRAVAAIGVTGFHIHFFFAKQLGLPSALQVGEAGVDLFFVISGFIMVYTSRTLFGCGDAPRTFMMRRIVRIVPLYWAVTTFYLIIDLMGPGVSRKTYSAEFAAASYLFIPFRTPEGWIEPVVGQGWTLNYEMWFYVIFSLSLLAKRWAAVGMASALLVATTLATAYFDPQAVPLHFWGQPIVLEFLLGMVLGLAYLEGLRVPAWCGAVLIVAAAVLACLHLGGLLFAGAPRVFGWGIPSTILVAGAAFAPPWRASLAVTALVIVGDASYALYLLHAVPMHVLQVLLPHFGAVHDTWSVWFIVLTMLVSAILLAVLVHYGFERPVGRALRALGRDGLHGAHRVAG